MTEKLKKIIERLDVEFPEYKDYEVALAEDDNGILFELADDEGKTDSEKVNDIKVDINDLLKAQDLMTDETGYVMEYGHFYDDESLESVADEIENKYGNKITKIIIECLDGENHPTVKYEFTKHLTSDEKDEVDEGIKTLVKEKCADLKLQDLDSEYDDDDFSIDLDLGSPEDDDDFSIEIYRKGKNDPEFKHDFYSAYKAKEYAIENYINDDSIEEMFIIAHTENGPSQKDYWSKDKGWYNDKLLDDDSETVDTAFKAEDDDIEDIILDSINHFKNDLGINPEVSHIIDDLLANYDIIYEEDNPELTDSLYEEIVHVARRNNITLAGEPQAEDVDSLRDANIKYYAQEVKSWSREDFIDERDELLRMLDKAETQAQKEGHRNFEKRINNIQVKLDEVRYIIKNRLFSKDSLKDADTLKDGSLINTYEFINGVNNSSRDYYEKTVRFFGGGGVIITLTSLTKLYVTDIDTNETVLFATLENTTNKNQTNWELRDKLLDLEIILSRSNWREELKFEDSLTKVQDSSGYRTINTNLENNNKNNELLNSVIGQLSDGIWENSRMNRYWEFLEIDGVNILSSLEPFEKDGGRFLSNATYDLNDEQIRKFFANKLKQIVKKEGLEWNRDNQEISSYLGYGEEITVADVYKAYDVLLGRNNKIQDGYPDHNKMKAAILEAIGDKIAKLSLTEYYNETYVKFIYTQDLTDEEKSDIRLKVDNIVAEHRKLAE